MIGSRLFFRAALGLLACVAACSVRGGEPAASEQESWQALLKLPGEHGISFPFSYTGEVLGNLSGGVRQGAVYEGLLKVGVQVDLEKLAGWKGATVLVNMLYPHGSSLTDGYVHDFNTLSNIDAYNSLRLYEAWFEQNLADGKFSIRIGQIAVDSEFCNSNGGAVFINGAFGALPLLSKNLDSPCYPIAAPGVRVRVAPNGTWFGQAGVFVGDAGDQGTNNRYGTRFFSGNNGVLLVGEIGFNLNPPPKPDETKKGDAKKEVASGRPLSGTYKLGGFYDTLGRDRLDGSGSVSGDYAIYLIADQEIWHEPGDPDQGLRLFGRIGAAPDDRNAVSFYFDAGLNYQGLIPGRDKDVAGLGVSYTKISGNLRDDNGWPMASHHETIIEATYQAVVTNWLSVQPDFQYIFNPGATGTLQNAVVAGVRFNINF